MDEGRNAVISEISAAGRIERRCLSTLLRLTLLVPGLVEAILNGRQTEEVTLPGLLKQPASDRGGDTEAFMSPIVTRLYFLRNTGV